MKKLSRAKRKVLLLRLAGYRPWPDGSWRLVVPYDWKGDTYRWLENLNSRVERV